MRFPGSFHISRADPFVFKRPEENKENHILERDEKTGIIYKKWLCPTPSAVFLLVHGLGAYSGRWDLCADFFLQNNISSYAIELEGFGETKGPQGHIDSFDIYEKNILTLLDIIKKENSGKKVYLIGESMGALISFATAALYPTAFDGLLCISAAFKSRLKFSFWNYLKISLCLFIDPKHRLSMPFDSTMCTRDANYLKTMNSEDREHKFATPKLLFNILLAQHQILSLSDKIKIPVLFLIAGNLDQLTDPEAVKKVYNCLKTPDKNIIVYPDMLHALSVELDREKVFTDILNWINKRKGWDKS